MEKVLKGGEGIGPGVPQFAWIMTARTMLSAKEVFVIVPSPATQHVVAALCRNGVNPNITATLLYTHPKVSLYLDNASAELLTPADIARATQPVAIPAAVKASSAGAQEPRNVTDITVQYAQQMAHANANFRQALQGISASTSQSPDVDAQAAISFLKDASHQLGQAIDAYRQIKATAQNPQDVSAAAFNLQYATDTVRTVDSVLYAGSNKEMRAEFNLVIEKTPQTQEQFDMARSIGEIDKIKELLGCNIICADTGEITALQAQGVNPANTIVVTATQAGANNFAVFKRMIDLKNLNTGQYLNLTALSLLAKGLYLIDKVDTASVSRIKNAIQTAYRNLTGNALPTADLDRYVASPAEFIIEVILGHDVGVAYEKGELENLHRQAFAVLIAA
jgi:hypothetical protein